MFDSDPPGYTEPIYHPYFHFSNDIATFQVENIRFKVHRHFLTTYSSVFRDIFQQQPSSSKTSDDKGSSDENSRVIHLDGVSVVEFESLLTFFYQSWQESFTMPIARWIDLLSIIHRFKFTEAEVRARREVFGNTGSRHLSPVHRITLSEKHAVPVGFIIPALEDLVRRTEPLTEKEIVDLSGEMVARIVIAREKYVRQSSRMFATENWLKRVALELAHDIVMSVWSNEEAASVGASSSADSSAC